MSYLKRIANMLYTESLETLVVIASHATALVALEKEGLSVAKLTDASETRGYSAAVAYDKKVTSLSGNTDQYILIIIDYLLSTVSGPKMSLGDHRVVLSPMWLSLTRCDEDTQQLLKAVDVMHSHKLKLLLTSKFGTHLIEELDYSYSEQMGIAISFLINDGVSL